MAQQNDKKSLLEKASWVASISSLVLAIIVWMLPSPLSISDFSPISPTNDMTIVLRLLAFLTLIAFTVTAIAFSRVTKGEKIRFHFEFRGNWKSMQVMAMGFFIILLSAGYVIKETRFQADFRTLFMFALLLCGLIITLSGFWINERGILAIGKIWGQTKKGWARLAAFLIVLGALSILLIALVVIKFVFSG